MTHRLLPVGLVTVLALASLALVVPAAAAHHDPESECDELVEADCVQCTYWGNASRLKHNCATPCRLFVSNPLTQNARDGFCAYDRQQ